MNFYKIVYFDKAARQKRKTLCGLMNKMHIIGNLTDYIAYLFLLNGNLLISHECETKLVCVKKSEKQAAKRIICIYS